MKIAYVFKDLAIVPVGDHLEEIDQLPDDYVKFEIAPPNNNIRANFSEWIVSRVGNCPYPNWWNNSYYLKVIKAFQKWHKEHFIFSGASYLEVVNGTYYVFEDATLYAGGTAIVYAFDHSSIFVSKKAKVFAHDYSTIRALDKSIIIAKDFSEVSGEKYADITLLDHSKATVTQNCLVHAADNSFVKAYFLSRISVYSENATVEAHGGSTVFVYNSGTVQAHDKSTVKIVSGFYPKIFGYDESVIITDNDTRKNIKNYDNSITINRHAHSIQFNENSYLMKGN